MAKEKMIDYKDDEEEDKEDDAKRWRWGRWYRRRRW